MGLRERKKARTRSAIQQGALRLFSEQGYHATTTQQIAAAADVSESTFFRYFPTKADVVLSDDFDPVIIAAFERQPPELSPIRALRMSLQAAFAELTPADEEGQRVRTMLVLAVPELRAAMLDQLAQAMEMIVGLLAQRTGRPASDLKLRTSAGAVMGAMIAVMFAVSDDPAAQLGPLLDDAIAQLEGGLVL